MLSEFRQSLNQVESLVIELPTGKLVAPHAHVTEVGKITRNFVDCGGVVRTTEAINVQLWEATDYDHRLDPAKLEKILEKTAEMLGLPDGEIEVEYQGHTVEKYGLEFTGKHFKLTPTYTDCLAKSACTTPAASVVKPVVSSLPIVQSSCKPGSGCC